MGFELQEILDQEKDHNPYITWGEDIGRYLDNREFFLGDRIGAGDLRQVFIQCRNESLSADDAFARVESTTGVGAGDVEVRLSSDLFGESGRALEFIALVDADWTLVREKAENGSKEAAFLDDFKVLAAGPRLFAAVGSALTEPPLPTGLGRELVRTVEQGTITLAGIIDDGIPYLNRRFFNGLHPRIISLLIQTAAFFPDDGKVETTRTLDTDLIRQRRRQANKNGERATYIAANRNDPRLAGGIPVGVQKTVEQASSHGAFMLDLMCGAKPGPAPGHSETSASTDAALRQIPILAAQLPPQSVEDTSGARLELPILAALRWMIAKAAELRPARLVVNLSFGVSAGSKDGNSFLEKAFERLVAKAAEHGVEVELVLPFGNEYLSRGVQVSTMVTQPDATPEVDLMASAEIVLARADETPSFVEIRAKGLTELPSDLKVAISNPDGETTEFKYIAPGQSLALTLPNEIPGRLFHIPARTFFEGDPQGAHLLLAMSPTAEPRRLVPFNKARTSYPESIALAAPGRWKIHLSQPASTTQPIEAIFQVQRDDSAFGYHNRGAQTFLDAPDAHATSAIFRDFSGLGDSDITHRGTNTAYVSRQRAPGANGGAIHAVAAARTPTRSGEVAGSVAPTYYGSERAEWSAEQAPDVAIALDTEQSNPGVTATGVVSGSAMRQTGSSAAAALYSRRLLLGTMLSDELNVTAGEDRLGSTARPLPDDLVRKKRRRAS